MDFLVRIRNAFRKEYIGAILIALVLMQVVSGSIGIAMMPVWFWARQSVQRSLFGSPDARVFAWNDLLGSVIQLVLYALIAYALLRWLYLERPQPGSTENDAGDDHV